MTVSPVDGRLYISDFMRHRVVRVLTMGPVQDLYNNLEVVAGTGEECTPRAPDLCGDGRTAVTARLRNPRGESLTPRETCQAVVEFFHNWGIVLCH